MSRRPSRFPFRHAQLESLEARLNFSQDDAFFNEVYAWSLVNEMRENPHGFGQELNGLYHQTIESAHGIRADDPVWADLRRMIDAWESWSGNTSDWFSGFNANVPEGIESALERFSSLPATGPLALHTGDATGNTGPDQNLQRAASDHNQWMFTNCYTHTGMNSCIRIIPGLAQNGMPASGADPWPSIPGFWGYGENIGETSIRTQQNYRHTLDSTRQAYDAGQIDATGYALRAAYFDTVGGFMLDWGNGPSGSDFGHLMNLAAFDVNDGSAPASGPKARLSVRNAIGVDVITYQNSLEPQDSLHDSWITTHQTGLDSFNRTGQGGYLVGLAYVDFDGDGQLGPADQPVDVTWEIRSASGSVSVNNGAVNHNVGVLSHRVSSNGTYQVAAVVDNLVLGVQEVTLNHNNGWVEFAIPASFGLLGAPQAPTTPSLVADGSESNETSGTAVDLGLVSWDAPLLHRQVASLHHAGDEDWFRFQLTTTPGDNDRITIGHDSQHGNVDARLYRQTANGLTLVAERLTSEDLKGFDLSALQITAGTYFLQVSGAPNFYSLDIRIATDKGDAQGDSLGTAQPLGNLVSVDGEIHAYTDEDWFAFAAETGDRFDFQVVLGTLADSRLEIRDAQGNVLASSDDVSASDLSSRVSWTSPAEATYFARVTSAAGHVGSYTLQQATTLLTGQTLEVWGTGGDDLIRIDLQASGDYSVEVNGATASYPAGTITQVVVRGQAGEDQLELTGSAGDDTVHVTTSQLTFASSAVSLTASGLESLTVAGGGGADQATLEGAAATADRFTAGANYAIMAAMSGPPAYQWRLNHFAHVVARASGSGDRAYLYDSPGSDRVDAHPTYVEMTGSGFVNRAEGYAEVAAYSNNSADDQAYLFGDPLRAERFAAGKGYASMRALGPSPSYVNWVYNFELVVASAAGHGDLAFLYDSPGDDTFRAFPASARMTDDASYDNRANGFAEVTGYARNSGHDVAYLTGSAGPDRFVAGASYGWMADDVPPGQRNYYLAAWYFDELTGNSAGANDRAVFYDSPQDDVYRAYPASARMYSTTYDNRAVGFGTVTAYANNGGHDEAFLFDSADNENDRFGSGTNYAYLRQDVSSPGYENWAYRFERVTAESRSGVDLAIFYDSPGDDLFFGRSGLGRLSGTDFWNEALRFAEVRIFGVNGGTNSRNISALDYLFAEYGNWVGAGSGNAGN